MITSNVDLRRLRRRPLCDVDPRHLLFDFRRIRAQKVRVVLMDMAARVLPHVGEIVQECRAALRRLGVELMLNTAVIGVDEVT